MKRALKASTILSWVNIIIWGLVALIFLLLGLSNGNMGMLMIAFLFSVVVLHSYAALQLHKSIRDPAVPLSNQTPIGIRFIGFIALFFGISYLAEGFSVLQNAGETLKFLQSQMPQLKDAKAADIRAGGVIALLLGLSISLNVVLNFRLLRWYQYFKNNQGGNSNQEK